MSIFLLTVFIFSHFLAKRDANNSKMQMNLNDLEMTLEYIFLSMPLLQSHHNCVKMKNLFLCNLKKGIREYINFAK